MQLEPQRVFDIVIIGSLASCATYGFYYGFSDFAALFALGSLAYGVYAILRDDTIARK